MKEELKPTHYYTCPKCGQIEAQALKRENRRIVYCEVCSLFFSVVMKFDSHILHSQIWEDALDESLEIIMREEYNGRRD